MVDSRWTPVRDGAKYCSPACGTGCTIDAFVAAHEGANRLAAELGEGWKPRVWENMGWHFSAQLGQAEVSRSRSGACLCIINHAAGSAVVHADTPRDAFEQARDKMQERVEEARRQLAVLNGEKFE